MTWHAPGITSRVNPKRSGFSLIEMIAAMVVLSFLASSASILLGQLAVVYRDRSLQGQLHIETDVALNRIAREMRSIDAIEEGDEFMPSITEAGRHAVSWSDDNSIRLDGMNVLINTDGENTDVLATDVASLSFDFLDDEHRTLLSGDSVAPQNLKEIRRIAISLTIERGGCSERLHTLIFVRSMMRPSE